nr:hypothetical protein [Nitrosomonas nitrosa]
MVFMVFLSRKVLQHFFCTTVTHRHVSISFIRPIPSRRADVEYPDRMVFPDFYGRENASLSPLQ